MTIKMTEDEFDSLKLSKNVKYRKMGIMYRLSKTQRDFVLVYNGNTSFSIERVEFK